MESPPDHPIHSFHAALRNLDKLEREDFREVIKSQFNPTLRERYLTVNYHRAAFNVEMMVAIKDTKQFQTLSLLARTIFELAVEMKSIIRDSEAEKKIELFSKVELLKSARKIVKYYDGRPDARYYKQQFEFVDKFGTQIDADEAAMRPPNPATRRKLGLSPGVRQTVKRLGTVRW